jgi:hypothetical protein
MPNTDNTDLAALNPEESEPKPAPAAPATNQSAAEPSGYKGDNPSTAGPGSTEVNSTTPENAKGHLNPSAPEDANVTPGSTTTK